MDSNDAKLPNRSILSSLNANVAHRAVRLPHDIIFLIFNEGLCIPLPFDFKMHLSGVDEWEELLRGHDDSLTSSAATLAVYCLVSREWNEVATPLLYRNLQLKSQHQVFNAVDTLESFYGSLLPWVGSPHGEFVKYLDIGDLDEFERTSETITALKRIILRCPNLRSFCSVYPYSVRNSLSIQSYSVKVVKSLIEHGRDLTTLYVSDYDFLQGDLNKLVGRLPKLETLLIQTTIQWELQKHRLCVSSLSLRTLIVASRYEAIPTCLNSGNLNVVAAWDLPNLHTVIIHDRCQVAWVLMHMTSFLSKHQVNLQRIIFRRWCEYFTEADENLLVAQFPEFGNVIREPTSVQILKG